MRDVLVGRPDLPQFRSTGPLAPSVGINQRNRFTDACSSPRLLMPTLDKVTMQVDDICDARPMLLNVPKLTYQRAYAGFVVLLMHFNPTISSIFIIWPNHVSDQRYSLFWPLDVTAKQPSLNDRFQVGDMNPAAGKSADLHRAHAVENTIQK